MMTIGRCSPRRGLWRPKARTYLLLLLLAVPACSLDWSMAERDDGTGADGEVAPDGDVGPDADGDADVDVEPDAPDADTDEAAGSDADAGTQRG